MTFMVTFKNSYNLLYFRLPELRRKFFYHKLNNLSLGVLDLYYRTLADFLESLFIKYDYYNIYYANIKKN